MTPLHCQLCYFIFVAVISVHNSFDGQRQHICNFVATAKIWVVGCTKTQLKYYFQRKTRIYNCIFYAAGAILDGAEAAHVSEVLKIKQTQLFCENDQKENHLYHKFIYLTLSR